MKTKKSGILSMLLAFVMTFAMIFPMSQVQVFAADQISNGSEGIMAYHHPSGEKYVDYDFGGNDPGYPRAADLGVETPWYVYCINPTRSARDNSKWNQHFRWRWNLGANKWLLDNSRDQNKRDNPGNKDNMKGQEAYDDLMRILYYGHPYNYGGGNFTYADTQAAVEGLLCNQKDSQNDLYKKAVTDSATNTLQVNGNLYMFIADSDAKQVVQNTVGLAVWGEPSNPGGPTPSTPDKPGDYDETPAERSASVNIIGHKTINGKEEGYIREEGKDQFAFRLYVPDRFNGSSGKDGKDGNDNNGGYHTRRLPNDTDDSAPGEIAFGQFRFTPDDGGKTFKFTAREIMPSESFDYPTETPNMIYDNTKFEIEISVEKVTVDGVDTVKLTCNGDDVTNGVIEIGTWNNRIAELNTTVSCGGSTADKESPAQVTVPTKGTTKDVVDKIDYKGLDAGATYKVSGSLYEVEDGKTVGEPVATATEEKKAEKADGTWEITFKNVKLQPNKTYVVFETAKLIKDSEGNEVKDGVEIKHENPKDQAQTIITNEGGMITTKVQNQYISPAKNQKIIDIASLGGFEDGKTYTLKGVIKNKKDGSDVTAQYIPVEFEYDASADSNEVGIEFYGIDASKFKAGDQLVVFEYLYEGSLEQTKDFKPGDGNEIAKHADINDAAQTATIVDGQIKLKKTTKVTSAKPGDVIPYTITVTNERKVPARVQIVDNPEEGLVFVEANKDGIYDSEVGIVVWDNVEIAANSTVELTVSFKISQDADGTIVNRAHVFEPDNDENVLGFYEDDSPLEVLGVSEDEGTKTKGAKTGDESNLALMITLMLAAAAGVAGMAVRRRMNS